MIDYVESYIKIVMLQYLKFNRFSFTITARTAFGDLVNHWQNSKCLSNGKKKVSKIY